MTQGLRGNRRRGYRLLAGLDRIPGMDASGEIDGDYLLQWVLSVRSLAVENDRVTVTDTKIGNVLAHSPPDPTDSAWPHRAVRDVIEQVSASEVEEGIIIGRYNMRGVVCRDPFAGGEQEKELARQHRAWSKACSRWPRVARMLERIAEQWDAYARREDDEAKQRELD